MMQMETLQRDERGRVIAPDGYPISGMATVNEAMAISGLSRSKVYQMIASGDLETRRYGKSRRITWASIRAAFLGGQPEGASDER